jgi:hypothetical protein
MSQRSRRGTLKRSGTSRLKEHPNLGQFFRDLEWDRSNQDAYEPASQTPNSAALSGLAQGQTSGEFTPTLVQLQQRSRRRARGS